MFVSGDPLPVINKIYRTQYNNNLLNFSIVLDTTVSLSKSKEESELFEHKSI